MMELHNGIKTFYAKTALHWRKWLQKNHVTEKGVWLIMYNKGSGVPTLSQAEAVEEALCFGWVDSKANKRDDKSRYQFFAKRKLKGNWSKINKARVEKLMAEGKMEPPGLEVIEIARQNGSWTALDDVENFVMPPDLQKAFNKSKKAFKNWNGFSPSSRKSILAWISSAKTPQTRLKRIEETVALAKENKKANEYIRKQEPRL